MFIRNTSVSYITKAANQFYIGQGTASSRIRHLEEELGIQLFFRQKGIKNITLTPEGEEFFSIAQQWVLLQHQAGQIKNRLIFRELRITAVETLNQFLFVDIYQEFMEKYPEIILYLQTEHSTEIHQLIESQQVDLGFAYSLHKSPNVIARPLYREPMVILYHASSSCSPSDLSTFPPEMEICQTFGMDYELWHHRRFTETEIKKVTIGTMSMLPSFIRIPGSWTILPQSIADLLVRQSPGLCYGFIPDDPPPVRTAYILQYRYPSPWIRHLNSLFLSDVVEMIRKNPAMELLYTEPPV